MMRVEIDLTMLTAETLSRMYDDVREHLFRLAVTDPETQTVAALRDQITDAWNVVAGQR